MENEITKSGKVVGRSQNLRGILGYARKARTFVDAVTIARRPGGKGWLQVLWADKAVAETEFNSFVVLCEWLGNRQSWRGARLVYKGEVMDLTWANLADIEKFRTEIRGSVTGLNEQQKRMAKAYGVGPDGKGGR